MRIRNPFERLSDWQGNYIECLSRAYPTNKSKALPSRAYPHDALTSPLKTFRPALPVYDNTEIPVPAPPSMRLS